MEVCSIFLIFPFYVWKCFQTFSNQIITLNYISITNQPAKKRSSVPSLPRLNWSQICRIGASGWHFNCSNDNCNHNCYFIVSFYNHIHDHGNHDSVVWVAFKGCEHDSCNDCNEVFGHDSGDGCFWMTLQMSNQLPLLSRRWIWLIEVKLPQSSRRRWLCALWTFKMQTEEKGNGKFCPLSAVDGALSLSTP